MRSTKQRRRSPARALALICTVLVAASFIAAARGGAAEAAFVDTGGVQTAFASTAAVPLDFVGVDAGDDYSLGWTSDGRLFAWGANARGQLGVGDLEPRSIPTVVPFPSGVSIEEASAGVNMTIALATNGDVYTWGNSDVSVGVTSPGLISELAGQQVVGVSAGGFFFLAWTADGRLYSWGSSGGGRLGRAGTGNLLTPGLVTAQGIDSRSVTSASAGRTFAAASVDGGTALIGWGTSYGSATGVGFTGLPANSPVAGLSAGNAFTFAWTADGRLYSGSSTAALSQTTGFAGVDVVGATVSVPSAGTSSFYVWDDQSRLYAWGLNSSGQLGLGDEADRASPVPVTMPPGVSLLALGAGNAHALLVGVDGAFASVGSNSSGQLGTDDTAARNSFSTPVVVVRWP